MKKISKICGVIGVITLFSPTLRMSMPSIVRSPIYQQAFSD